MEIKEAIEILKENYVAVTIDYSQRIGAIATGVELEMDELRDDVIQEASMDAAIAAAKVFKKHKENG